MEWDGRLWVTSETGKWKTEQISQEGGDEPRAPLHLTHTHTPAGSENEIFQAAISAANSITEGTCTKSCDFPDGEIGKG